MPQNEALIHKCSEMFKFVQTGLLADAETLEDGVEGVVGGDGAGDFGKGIDALMEVEGDDVAGCGTVGELALDCADGL